MAFSFIYSTESTGILRISVAPSLNLSVFARYDLLHVGIAERYYINDFRTFSLKPRLRASFIRRKAVVINNFLKLEMIRQSYR